MKGVTTARGLSDLRTATSRHVRAIPPQKGTSYLELYLLNMERQRLASELARIDHRRGQISDRLGQIDRKVVGLQQRANEAQSGAQSDGEMPAAPRRAGGGAPVGGGARGGGGATSVATPGNRIFRQMTVGY